MPKIAPVALADVEDFGGGLTRPECVLATASGALWVSHHGGGVSRVAPDGTATHVLGPGDPTVRTNGFGITPEGDFLCACLVPPGGVWRITPAGEQQPFLTEVEGEPLPQVNFATVDAAGRAWITVSTRRQPRDLGYRPDVDDGFVVLVDERGARIVADGLGYTNEAKVSPDGHWLYVNETFARRTSRYRLVARGALGARETVAEYGHGVYPDGLEFDAEGGVWITSVVSNRVIRVDADGGQTLVLEDCDAAALDEVERAFLDGRLGREHLDSVRSERLKSVSSIAFGGPDLRTAYLGNLLDDCVYRFASPVAGAEPPHWKWAG